MEKVKRCGGYRGHWGCGKKYPDHMVPVEKFGRDGDGLHGMCRKCQKYYDGIRNPKMPRHPETNQRKMNWLSAKAKEYYGGMPEDPKTDEHWKACRAMATKDAESIAWVIPNDSQPSNIVSINSVTLKSTVRNDGLPEGIVTQSEKKARREFKRIKYEPEGWIYALKNHMAIPGFLKLGMSNDLKRRLAGFNTAGDFEMMYWVKVVDAKVAEDMLHAYFIDSHHLREWFKVDLKDAIKAMDSIANTVNNNEGDASENAISQG